MSLPMERAIAARRRPVQEVSVFGLQHRSTGERTKRPWIVRWAIQGRQRSRAFRT